MVLTFIIMYASTEWRNKMNKLIVLILAMSMASLSQAQIKFDVLDQWKCGEDVCAIALDPQKNYVLLMSDQYGIYAIVFHGKVVWQRKAM